MGKSSQHPKHCAVSWASLWGIDSNVLRYSWVMSFGGSHLELVFQSMVLEMIPARHDLFTNAYKQQSPVKIHPAFNTHYKLRIPTTSRETGWRSYYTNWQIFKDGFQQKSTTTNKYVTPLKYLIMLRKGCVFLYIYMYVYVQRDWLHCRHCIIPYLHRSLYIERNQGQNHGCSCSRFVAVCLILLPRKCLDIKFCWLELSCQQATCCWELSRQ